MAFSIRCLSRDRLVVRTLRCGRSNPGSNPGHGMDKIFGGLEIDNEEVFPRKRQQDTSSGYSLTKAPTYPSHTNDTKLNASQPLMYQVL